jgi:sensor domain CHASE-containing protein
MWKLFNGLTDKHISLVMAFVVSFGVLLIFFPITLISIYATITQGDYGYTQDEVRRTAYFLNHTVENLDQVLAEWSSWDETYLFVQGQNPTFPEINFNSASLTNLDIDIFRNCSVMSATIPMEC